MTAPDASKPIDLPRIIGPSQADRIALHSQQLFSRLSNAPCKEPGSYRHQCTDLETEHVRLMYHHDARLLSSGSHHEHQATTSAAHLRKRLVSNYALNAPLTSPSVIRRTRHAASASQIQAHSLLRSSICGFLWPLWRPRLPGWPFLHAVRWGPAAPRTMYRLPP